MIESGWIIYLLLVAILYWFWRRTRGLSFDDLLERDAEIHHLVQKTFEEHPDGGTWREYKAWLKER